ncbi:MAG: glycoside hydrolase family 3 C-terminal domain-containing protein [Caldicoprobacterales bacterium]|jgi:beta-glucosidase|nr:glycoside hydrolase family 3 protein [Clostridiales bacterium]
MSERITTQEAEKRARELVEQMTIEERASQLRYNAPAIERLNIPAYNWWNEALHGVARGGTATMFPQAIGMAAMFDDEFLQKIADIISTEGRAKYNEAVKHGDHDIYKGLTFWSPNINIFRDPRWGRGHETYGEDPYLTGRLGVAFIKGLQGEGKYLKAAACAKHYAVHSGPESLRHEFDAIASQKDMWETYLPAFEECVVEGKVESVMGAYNRTNGEPCCGSYTLLQDILREKWKFEGHVVSDCWAIRDFHTRHFVTSTAPESAALALKAGCDLNCGNTYLHMLQALEENLITEEDITRAAVRLFTTRIKLGMFDECEYDNIPYSVVDCKEHNEVALEAARKSLVLLKNDGILPLNKDKIKSIGVIGPNANSRLALKGNYYGTPSRYITILEGIQDYVEDDDIRVYYSEGCHLYEDRVEPLAQKHDRIAEALTVAEHSDVVILCLGLDETLEGEEGDTGNFSASGDKKDLNLPQVQQNLLEKVVAVGKPTILLLSTGSAMGINFADEKCNAIIQTWYPGARGGQAVAECLFGGFSPAGKLPVTFYRNVDDLPEFTDYTMKGRTYRYIETEPLYPFGYGMTYSKVRLSNLKVLNEVTKDSDIEVSVEIENIGDYDTDEVVQFYIKDNKSKFAVPNHSLCGFKRIHLKKGESKVVEFTIRNKAMTIVDDEGNRYIDSDCFTLFAGVSQPDKRSLELTGVETLSIDINI